MDESRYVSVAVALLCVTAIGMSATTLESTVATDPADEIDIDWDRVPLGQDTAADIRDDIEGDRSEEVSSVDAEGGDDSAGGAERDESASSGSVEAGTTAASQPEWSLWSALLAVLRVVIPILVLLILAGIAYRYRDRLLERIEQESTDDRREPPEDGSWPKDEPSTTVDRAWVAMVRRVNPERPATMTPAECAAAARESGLDGEAVDLVTSAFERVHYGGESPEALAEQAQTSLRCFGEDGEPTGVTRADRPTREDHT